jgi:hypothetical protein
MLTIAGLILNQELDLKLIVERIARIASATAMTSDSSLDAMATTFLASENDPFSLAEIGVHGPGKNQFLKGTGLRSLP